VDSVSRLPLIDGWLEYDWVYVLQNQDVDGDPVTLEEIEEVLHMYSSGGDTEKDLAALIQLTDNRWATLHAGNDYTGWGCQDYIRWRVFATRDEAIIMGLTNESRGWLKLELPT
jgi:hypothetical protein